MKKIRLACALLSVLLTLGICAFGQATDALKSDDAPILLRYHFHVDDVFNMKFVVEQKIKPVIQGQEITINQTLGMSYRMKVLTVDDKGNAEVKLTYRSVIWKQDGPMGNQAYDSAHPPATIPAEAQGYAALVDQVIMLKFAPDGQVLTVAGVDEMQKKMLAKLSLPAEMAAAVGKALKEQFGDKALKEMFEQVTRIYPEQAVKVGDAWDRHVDMSKGVALIMDNKYTLTARSKGISTITVKSVCKSNPKAGPLDMGLMTIKYDLNGPMEGKMEIVESSGWARSYKLTQQLSGTMDMAGPQLPQPMSVPVTIEGTTTVTTE